MIAVIITVVWYVLLFAVSFGATMSLIGALHRWWYR